MASILPTPMTSLMFRHLVNSTGGDWGYVTVVIPETDRNSSKWQKIFDEIRRLHLIPLVRLATKTVDDHWTKPTEESIKDWVPFLNGLNWPVENRYVILFNEPNHAKEWGGTLNPQEYARVSVNLAQRLKASSNDFYILPAGLDASAANDGEAMDAAAFLREAVKEKPEFLAVIDGWTSHAYPNPGFSGSPYAWGRGTLASFDWELGFLGQLGLTKLLPVFITETGWTHALGKTTLPALSEDQVSRNIEAAAQNAWSDPRIVAVTPFIFSYQDEPFDHFSWKKFRETSFYPQYFAYQALPKVKGQPQQREIFTFLPTLIPNQLVAGSTYNFTVKLQNSGQSILDPAAGFELALEDQRDAFPTVLFDPLPLLEPGEAGNVTIHLKTNKNSGIYPISLKLKHQRREIELEKVNLVLMPPPSLKLVVSLGWRKTSDAEGVTVLVYDLKQNLLEKFSGLKLQNGMVDVPGLTDIVPGEKYRVVMLVPYYLPRQIAVAIGKTTTEVKLKRLLPLDFDNDGGLKLHDLVALLQTKPKTVIGRFISP